MANDERLGASFSIDVTNLKAGLTQANRLIRESEANFRTAAAGIDNWTKSEEGLTKRQKALTEQIDIQKKKISALTAEKQRIIEKMTAEGKSQEDIAKATDNVNKQITKESKQLDKLEGELDKTNKSLDDLQKESDDAGDAVEDAGKQAEKSSDGFTVMKGALANLVADGFRKAIDVAKEFVSSMVEVGKTFDSAMAQVSAVSGATGDELETLREKAKEMGESTKFTATEAADAFNYMAMAGWKTEEMLGGIDGILNLAAASGADLATTSDIVTDALTAMGYKASDAGRLADVMAAASSNANTNVEMMGATFQYAAPLVGALGYTMEDTAVAIGLMANAGIKGEKAGTALRSVFTRLAAPPKAAAEAMEALSISLTDSQGKMKPFNQVIQELRESFNGLDETQQTQYASALAGQEAMSGLLAIVNAAPSDFDKLTKAVAESEGAAQKMADTMLDNLGGDMTILNSQIDGVRLTLYEKFEPTLRNAIKSVQKWIGKVNWSDFGDKATKALKSIIKESKTFGKNVLPTLKSALKVVGGTAKFVVDNFELLVGTVGTAVVVFKAFKAAMAVSTAITATKTAIAGLEAGVGLATKAQVGWNVAMSANPIGAVLTAVGLLAGGIALLVTAEKNALKNQDVLNESQREAVTAAQDAAEAYKSTKASADELAQSEIANINYTNTLWNELQTLADKNGKVKEGYESRAKFILNELNEALGTEYSMNDGIIQQYSDIKKSIDDIIEKKKAQILLDAYEETYAEAIKKRTELEKGRATQLQEVAKWEDEVAKKRQEYVDKMNEPSYMHAGDTTGWQMEVATLARNWENAKTKLGEAQEGYRSTDQAVKEVYANIEGYETASTLILEGETAKAVEILSSFGKSYQDVGSTAEEVAANRKKALEQEVIDTQINVALMEDEYKRLSKTMTEEEKKAAQERIKNAKKEADDAIVNFNAVGGNITKGIANGAENEETTNWTLTGAMKRLINKALSAARKAADEHSPSKLFEKKVGVGLAQGVAVGVSKGTKYVVDSVKKQVNDIKDAYDLSGISSSVDVGINSRSASRGNGNPTPRTNGVTVNQTNYYAQAHSRYELYKSKQQTAAAVRLALQGV